MRTVNVTITVNRSGVACDCWCTYGCHRHTSGCGEKWEPEIRLSSVNTKYLFSRTEKHQRDTNKPRGNKDGWGWRRFQQIANDELEESWPNFSRCSNNDSIFAVSGQFTTELLDPEDHHFPLQAKFLKSVFSLSHVQLNWLASKLLFFSKLYLMEWD